MGKVVVVVCITTEVMGIGLNTTGLGMRSVGKVAKRSPRRDTVTLGIHEIPSGKSDQRLVGR